MLYPVFNAWSKGVGKGFFFEVMVEHYPQKAKEFLKKNTTKIRIKILKQITY